MLLTLQRHFFFFFLRVTVKLNFFKSLPRISFLPVYSTSIPHSSSLRRFAVADATIRATKIVMAKSFIVFLLIPLLSQVLKITCNQEWYDQMEERMRVVPNLHVNILFAILSKRCDYMSHCGLISIRQHTIYSLGSKKASCSGCLVWLWRRVKSRRVLMEVRETKKLALNSWLRCNSIRGKPRL